MVPTIVILAALAAQELQYPILEKDPWHGFLPGSFVVRETNIGNRIRKETTITLKSIEVNSKTLTVLAQNEEEDETVEFISFCAMLVADGYKTTGKSNRVVPFGAAKVKALVREMGFEGDTS